MPRFWQDYVKWVEKLAGINLTADSMLERVRNPRKANAKPGGCGPGDLLLIIAGTRNICKSAKTVNNTTCTEIEGLRVLIRWFAVECKTRF